MQHVFDKIDKIDKMILKAISNIRQKIIKDQK